MDDSEDFEDFEPDFKLEGSDVEFGKCPNCNTETFELELIDDFSKAALKESNIEILYDSICINCYTGLKEQISHVGRLKAKKKQRLQELLDKWNTKLDILKTGRTLMSQKIYTEAQKYFEEYIKILEAIYNNGEEGLLPKMIPDAHRRQESTLLCTLFCDLIYIYDKFEPGTAKLKNMCETLILFLPKSRGQGTLLRKIKQLESEAKNKDIFENLFQDAKNKKNGCFVATAVFENSDAIELSILRNFRDNILKKNHLGRRFIFFYYKISPKFSANIKKITPLKLIIKYSLIIFSRILDPFI